MWIMAFWGVLMMMLIWIGSCLFVFKMFVSKMRYASSTSDLMTADEDMVSRLADLYFYLLGGWYFYACLHR